jgi:hypothetical protein
MAAADVSGVKAGIVPLLRDLTLLLACGCAADRQCCCRLYTDGTPARRHATPCQLSSRAILFPPDAADRLTAAPFSVATTLMPAPDRMF